MFDLYILLLLGCLGILLYPLPSYPGLARAVEILLIVLSVLSALVLNWKVGGIILQSVFQRMMRSSLEARTDQAFEDFHRGLEAYARPAILLPLLLTALSYVLLFAACKCLAQSIGLRIGFFIWPCASRC